MLLLVSSILAQNNKVNAQIFEDQYLICNHENECQVINIDDYISKDDSQKLEYNFQHDIDTFDLDNSSRGDN